MGAGFHAEPDVLLRASVGFLDTRRFVGDIAGGLVGDLAGTGGMGGDDHAGHAFANRYQPAAQQTVRAIGVAGGGLGAVSGRLLTMAWNYLKTEDAVAAAMNGGRIDTAAPARSAAQADECDPGSAHQQLPEVVGRHNWVVNHLIAPFWPEGDPDRLRLAAGRWTKAASLIGQAQGDAEHQVQTVLASCHGDAIGAFSRYASGFVGAGGILAEIRRSCGSLAAACGAYAGRIEDQRRHLQHLLEAAGVVTVVGGLLTVVTLGISDEAAAGVDAGIAAAATASVTEFAVAVETDAAVAALAEAEQVVAAAAARIPLDVPAGIAAPVLSPVAGVGKGEAGISLASVENAGFTTSIGAALNPVGPIPPPVPPFSPLLSASDQRAAALWAASLAQRPANYGTGADRAYQVRMAGSTEYNMPTADGKTVWADGYRSQDGAIIDAKNVRTPGCSPRTLDGVRDDQRATRFLLNGDRNEFSRYRSVLANHHNKAHYLEVDTNGPETVGYWQFLMAENHVHGNVRYEQ